MSDLGTISLYVAITAYAFVLGLTVFSWIFRSDSADRAGLYVLAGALTVHSLALVFRWASEGHAPLGGPFDNALAGSWFIVLLGIVVYWRWRFFINFKAFVSLAALVSLGYGLTFDQSPTPLPVSLRSFWVNVHVVLAWLAYSSLVVAFILAIVLIAKRGPLFQGLSFFPIHLPAEELATDLINRYVYYAFVMLTGTILTGSYYEHLAFGRWWGWDPVETITLGSWSFIILFLVAGRAFAGRTRLSAWLVVFGFAFAMVAYWLLVYLPAGSTFHIFNARPTP